MKLGKQKFNTKINRRIWTAIILFSLIFGTTSAQTATDINNTIQDKQQQLDQIRNEILTFQQEINQRQKQAASLKNEIALYDLQIRQTLSQIDAVNIQIDQLTAQILQTQIDIQDENDKIDKQKLFLAETLRLINEYDNVTPLDLMLANNTFSGILDQAQYTANLQERTQLTLDAIKALKAQLEAKKTQLDGQLAKQQQLNNQLTQTKNSLQDQRDARQSVLTRTKGQERIYQTLLDQSTKKQGDVEREILQLEIDVRQRLGDKSLPAIQGLLQWPMSGVLTQGYGNTGFTAMGYTFHNGIDIAAPAGTMVQAAGDGLVYATGTGTTAYGNWVVIKHTITTKDSKTFNIFTLYGHLQNFVVSPGRAVKGGDTIGYEGNTGNTTRLLYGPEHGFHLHFSVFDADGFGIQDGTYQNIYGPYKIPFGYTYNPLSFLQ